MAMLNENDTKISLDDVIKTMKATGEDMKSKYKETSISRWFGSKCN